MLVSRWNIKPPSARASSRTSRPLGFYRLGIVSRQADQSILDNGMAAHVQGKSRSQNQYKPRGLPKGFAEEKEFPPLPE